MNGLFTDDETKNFFSKILNHTNITIFCIGRRIIMSF